MTRGRPKKFATDKHVYVVVTKKQLKYIVAENELAALKAALGTGWHHGKVTGKIDVSEYLGKEKAYQDYFKQQYEKTR